MNKLCTFVALSCHLAMFSGTNSALSQTNELKYPMTPGDNSGYPGGRGAGGIFIPITGGSPYNERGQIAIKNGKYSQVPNLEDNLKKWREMGVLLQVPPGPPFPIPADPRDNLNVPLELLDENVVRYLSGPETASWQIRNAGGLNANQVIVDIDSLDEIGTLPSGFWTGDLTPYAVYDGDEFLDYILVPKNWNIERIVQAARMLGLNAANGAKRTVLHFKDNPIVDFFQELEGIKESIRLRGCSMSPQPESFSASASVSFGVGLSVGVTFSAADLCASE